ncbi:hypothetical protein CRG98_026819 [Punica granatum]|uniref:Uncharacterized protein n=1 Tax=Punica granatum TaxID=22663 RepID=A0A2I0J962_PUNGR|nr:hypothetical protein CRG98_026819 [Punica granatum]
MRGSLHLLLVWLLAHIHPFCSSHPFSYIADERSLIKRLVPVFPPPERSFSEWRHFWCELTPARFLWVARWNPGGPMITGCPGIVGVPLLSHLGSMLIFPSRGSMSPQRSQTTPIPRATPTSAPEAESSTQAAMRAELQSIREERDRLRCELVDYRVEIADYRELQMEAPGGPNGRVNGTRKRVHMHLRTIRTMEQVPDRLSRLLLVSRVSPDPEKGPCQMESNVGSAFGGKLTSELHATCSLPLLRRLSASLRNVFLTNRGHSGLRTPQDIWETLRKPRSQIFGLKPPPSRSNRKHHRVPKLLAGCIRASNNVPFPPTTLPSGSITFKESLITLNLPREEVVTFREPYHRAQPPFHPFSLYRICPLGVQGARSCTVPWSELACRAESCQAAMVAALRVFTARHDQPSLATPKATSPTLSLVHRG